MSVHNTPFDAANTSVRAFLTKIGELYLKRGFNIGSNRGKKEWNKIKESIFDSCCAYCGRNDTKLQIDHLIMFNRAEYGLHHPGNIVPACNKCNLGVKNKMENIIHGKNIFLLFAI